ncbi:MAG: hypothetical protein WA105_07280, partial [Candidatus Hydromicrobium sp.]
MRKNKLYFFLSILTIIFLFSFAALCTQCGTATEEEKIGVEEETAATEEETAATEEEVTEEEGEEAVVEEKEAPTIELEIYEGPTYSASDNVCYYRVKAIVTGKPGPTVKFNKDDSDGAWGSKKAQVNLDDPDETYTLIATATNSGGSATDSITLAWGCTDEEINKIENKIKILGDEAFINGTNEAINLLNTKARSYYDIVVNYIGIIQQVDKGSGIYVWEEPPRYV